jgi:hypothetical protein
LDSIIWFARDAEPVKAGPAVEILSHDPAVFPCSSFRYFNLRLENALVIAYTSCFWHALQVPEVPEVVWLRFGPLKRKVQIFFFSGVIRHSTQISLMGSL